MPILIVHLIVLFGINQVSVSILLETLSMSVVDMTNDFQAGPKINLLAQITSIMNKQSKVIKKFLLAKTLYFVRIYYLKHLFLMEKYATF